jgi:hypothetical protein
MYRTLGLSLTLGMVVSFCGCGGPPADAPEAAPVKGRVTRKGQPLAGVSVIYTPVVAAEGKGASNATTDADGYYVLIYNRNLDGAVPGEHNVNLIEGDGISNEDETTKDPNEVVIPKDKANHKVTVPPEGLDGGAANFDLDF